MNSKADSNRVSKLWDRLTEMERELRFNGKAYPEGMCGFPFQLRGQGFFPGGDGLWRNEKDLSSVSGGILPIGGVVFLGNDFGTLASYQKLQHAGYENVPTWRHIKLRTSAAGIPSDSMFFTNAIMGLRLDGTALTRRKWESLAGFPEFCGEYLQFQMEVLRPRLTVVMGPNAKTTFDSFAHKFAAGIVLYTSHPYADFGLSAERRADDIAKLREAWLYSGQCAVA